MTFLPSATPAGRVAAPAGTDLVTLSDASARLRADHDLLLDRVSGLADDQLAAPFRPASGPMGDFCESLHDLIAHVLMWDEISLAVLTEAAAGRSHWSLDPEWETPEAGLQLNRSGVEASRYIPASLLLHRFRAVDHALAAVFAQYTEEGWTGPGPASDSDCGIGALAQSAFTVPGHPAFWHAAIHLGQLPACEMASQRKSPDGDQARGKNATP